MQNHQESHHKGKVESGQRDSKEKHKGMLKGVDKSLEAMCNTRVYR